MHIWSRYQLNSKRKISSDCVIRCDDTISENFVLVNHRLNIKHSSNLTANHHYASTYDL